jgi:predicted AlkP superfamily phosphohydrolase/phosphomutase
VYEAIDRELGRIIECAGDAFTLVFSAHGMSHWFGTQFLLDDILVELGVTSLPDRMEGAEARRGPHPQALSPPLAALRWLWRRLPRTARGTLGPLRDRLREPPKGTTSLPRLGFDLSSSLCFPIPNGLAVGGIRLNLRRRDPSGTLDPNEAESFCRQLEADLLEIEERDTGRPLVRAVRRSSDLYEGEFLPHLPDLLVYWDDSVPIGSVSLAGGAGSGIRAFSEKTGPLAGRNEFGRSGEHRPNGFFVATGPDISSGDLNRTVSLMDLAPTLTHRLGVSMPGCRGVPIPELMGDGRDGGSGGG